MSIPPERDDPYADTGMPADHVIAGPVAGSPHTEYPWPPAKGLTTVVVPRDETVLCIKASIRINAPAQKVCDVVRDTSRYKLWNTWIPNVTIDEQPTNTTGEGQPPYDKQLHLRTKFTYHVHMDETNTKKTDHAKEIVSDYSAPDKPSDYVSHELLHENGGSFHSDPSQVYRIAWRDNGADSNWVFRNGMRCERFHEIIVRGFDGEKEWCELRTWENQAGPLAHIVKAMMGKTLNAKFEQWCAQLKGYCEMEPGPS